MLWSEASDAVEPRSRRIIIALLLAGGVGLEQEKEDSGRTRVSPQKKKNKNCPYISIDSPLFFKGLFLSVCLSVPPPFLLPLFPLSAIC